MKETMHHNRITAAQALADNLRTEGQTSCAEYVEELMNETLRLRQGLWDVAKVCGADTDGNDTPAPLVSDIVEFTKAAAHDLRDGYGEAQIEVRSLEKQLARKAPFEWDASKPNYWAGAWKYSPLDQRLEMCAAYPEMALSYMDELRDKLADS